MTDLRTAAQQALEALEESLYATTDKSQFLAFEAITALRAALAEPNRAQKLTEAGYTRSPTLREMAEPVQEPVACSNTFGCRCPKHYTAPPQRKPLSEEEEIERIRAAERERLIRAVESVPPHRWVDGSDQWGNPCPAKVVATKSDYVAAMRAADKRNVPTLAEPVQEPMQEPYTDDVTRIMRDAGMTFHLGLPHKAVVEQMSRVVDLVYAEASIKAAQQFAAPPQRKPLSEEEVEQCFRDAGITIKGHRWTNAVRNVEAAHGIK